MARTGGNSKSFLREDDFICKSDFGLQEKERKLFHEMFRRKADNKLFYKKSKILKTFIETLKFDRHIIINALHLQNYADYELRAILDDFINYIEDYGLAGVLEMHPADDTQKSWHFHFWTNNDSNDVYNLLKHYVLKNGYANAKNVDIQGQYVSFLDQVDKNDPDVEKYLQFKDFHEKWTTSETSNDVRIARTKQLSKLKNKATNYKDIVTQAMESNRNVKTVQQSAMPESLVSNRDIKQDIFKMIKEQSKQERSFVKEEATFKQRISKIPKSDINARIREIRNEIEKVNKRAKS